MTKVEEPRAFLVGVRLEVEQVVELMWRRHKPFFLVIQDIECSEHSISVWGNLEGGNSKVVGYPLKECMKRQSGTCLNMKPRSGTVSTSRQISPLVWFRLD